MDLYKPLTQEADSRRTMLVELTGAALSGLASMDHARHGCTPPTPEELGRRAVEMAKGALIALEGISFSDDLDKAISDGRIKPGHETDPAPTKRPNLPTPPQAALAERLGAADGILAAQTHEEPKHKPRGR